MWIQLFDTLMIFLKFFFFEKDDFEKISMCPKSIKILPSMQRVKHTDCNVNLGLIVED